MTSKILEILERLSSRYRTSGSSSVIRVRVPFDSFIPELYSPLLTDGTGWVCWVGPKAEQPTCTSDCMYEPPHVHVIPPHLCDEIPHGSLLKSLSVKNPMPDNNGPYITVERDLFSGCHVHVLVTIPNRKTEYEEYSIVD